ncbi:MAG: nitrilase-related carbon-nitrogen hydrolase, partial [Planctomycetota bacterium]
MRFALVQMNPTVGDLAGNAGKIIASIHRAKDAGARVVLLPE